MSQPAHKIPDGPLQVAIWRNYGENGNWYSVTHSRSYKDGDGNWKQTESLKSDDLLPLAELLRDAYAWIKTQRRADAKARKQSEQAATESEKAAA